MYKGLWVKTDFRKSIKLSLEGQLGLGLTDVPRTKRKISLDIKDNETRDQLPCEFRRS